MTRGRQLAGRASAPRGPHRGWEDKRLVAACLKGEEEAWSALVDKYKNLIYAIALRYGASSSEAADIFQAVWLDAYSELDKLRKTGSVRAWLITVTRNKCYHAMQRKRRIAARMSDAGDDLEAYSDLTIDPVAIEDLERDQLVRDAVGKLPPRCRELVRLLFYEEPPIPYKEVASRLGLAIGSIGFIRGRCLQKLRRSLEGRELG